MIYQTIQKFEHIWLEHIQTFTNIKYMLLWINSHMCFKIYIKLLWIVLQQKLTLITLNTTVFASMIWQQNNANLWFLELESLQLVATQHQLLHQFIAYRLTIRKKFNIVPFTVPWVVLYRVPFCISTKHIMLYLITLLCSLPLTVQQLNVKGVQNI